MCRFFAVNIFWNHRIRQFDYYSESQISSWLCDMAYSLLHPVTWPN